MALTVCLAVGAQTRLTVEQLLSFVRSSIQLKHEDRRVAEYLGRVSLTQRLDASAVGELQRLGAGPKTLEALERLVEASKALAPPAPAAPQPAPATIPPPSPEEQKKILDDTREYALSYTKALPDFLCTQVTRRYVDPTGLEFWQRQDVLTTRLSYFEQKEDYKLILINGVMTDRPYQSMGGATSTGEFGSMLREVFEPDTLTRFRWERWATLRGRRTHVFSYRVAQPQSKWRVEYERSQSVVPGYRGLVYVDRDTSMVMRLTLEAEDIPPSFPIQEVSTVLDYDFTKISDREYVLPLRAVVRMRQGRFLSKNEVEFRLYRKFAAEATITFETPEPLPEEKTAEQPPKP